MNWLRALSVFLLFLSAQRICRALISLRLPRWIALFISIQMITLPAFQVFAGYLCTWVGSLGTLCAVLAFEKRNRLIAIPCVIFSLCLYQQTAFIYFSLFAAQVVLETPAEVWAKRKTAIRQVLVFFLALCLYYFAWRIWYQVVGVPSQGKYDGREIAGDWVGRSKWVIHVLLPQVFSFWSLFPKNFMIFLSLFAFGLGCILDWMRSSIFYFCSKYLWIGFLFILSFFPLVMISQPMADFRVLTGIEIASVVLVFLQLYRFLDGVWNSPLKRQVLHTLFGVFAVYGILLCHLTLTNAWVRPDETEIKKVTELLRSAAASRPNFKYVHVIPYRSDISGVKGEWGEPILRHGPNIRPAIRFILREAGLKTNVGVSFEDPSTHENVQYLNRLKFRTLPRVVGPESLPEETLIIDMSRERL